MQISACLGTVKHLYPMQINFLKTLKNEKKIDSTLLTHCRNSLINFYFCIGGRHHIYYEFLFKIFGFSKVRNTSLMF